MRQQRLDRQVTMRDGDTFTVVFEQEVRVLAKHLVKHVLNRAEAWHELEPERLERALLERLRAEVLPTLPADLHSRTPSPLRDADVMRHGERLDPLGEPYAAASVHGVATASDGVLGKGLHGEKQARFATGRGLVVRCSRRGQTLRIETAFRADGMSEAERARTAVRKLRSDASFLGKRVCRPRLQGSALAPTHDDNLASGRPT